MIYKFFKKMHRITSFVSFATMFLYASTSDFNAIELSQTEPKEIEALLPLSIIFILPEVVYRLLKLYKNKFIERMR